MSGSMTPKALYDRWINAWTEFTPEVMKELWDSEYGPLIYQAEELSSPLTTFEDIKSYWDRIPESIECVLEVRPLEYFIQEFEVISSIFCRVFISLRIFSNPKPLSGEMRLSFVSKKNTYGWKLIHYHESREMDIKIIMNSLTQG